MQALILHGPGDIRFECVPVPTVGPGEVLIEVGWCGVCGSDLPRIFRTGAHRRPLIPGHEFSGTVCSVAEDVQGIAVGSEVVVFPLLWCGHCAACERGAYAQCADYDYLGSRRDGAFAEYVTCPARNVREIPDGLGLDVAAITEPASVALHAVRRVQSRLVGATVAVFGAGPIGNMAAQWSQQLGAREVLVFDIAPERLALARATGLANVHDSASRSASEVVLGLTGGGASICIEAAGVPDTVVEACRSVRPGGVVVLLGNPAADVVIPSSVVSRLLRTEASVVGVWNSSFRVYDGWDDWSIALQAMAAHELDVTPLISRRVPLSQGVEALHRMVLGERGSAKVLMGGQGG
jgi:L-iditol 2-dehydrogenase